MKPTRIFATASLIISSIALITAASISVGEEPGVVRMTTFSPQDGSPAPVPDSMGSGGVATMEQPPVSNGPYPVPGQYAPYFERSYSATQGVPGAAYQPAQPFGPIIMFESNFGKGLGYDQGYQRFNARVPYHISPNANVLIGDLSANVTFDGQPLGNAGLIYRNYDESRNRIFGYNGYLDYGRGYTSADWYRAGVGVESLGKYIDFRANGYRILGDQSNLLSSQLVGGLILTGNNVARTRNNLRENAYSGGDFEVGGPLPLLGRYGQNLYAGAYILGSTYANDTVGFQARWQALVTQNVTVNTFLTTDKTFGTNSWVNLQYEIPNYKGKRVLRASGVRERLSDPVVRSNRIQTQIETDTSLEACINSMTGLAYNILYVDPNLTGSGTGLGTFENPYKNLSALVNNANVDVIRIAANTDGSGTDLTRNGGLALFNNQALISANSDYELFRIGSTPFFIPGNGATGPGPLLSNPTMVAGGSVVQLANNNTIVGMRFDASNTAGTVFGNGVSNALPAVNLRLQNNTFTNYVVGADLTDLSGRVIVEGNTFTGQSSTATIASTYGMKMTVAGGSTASLLLNNNTATNNKTAGLSVTANVGSTLNADDPNGVPVAVVPSGKYVNVNTNTGITNNVVTGNGNGIELLGKSGSRINAVVQGNTASNNTINGLVAETDGGIFNLASMRTNLFSSNTENGAFVHYLNGGTFRSTTEDADGDGTLDAGEDLNGNGLLDQGIVSNSMNNNGIAGLCIFGEDASTGTFDIGGPTTTLGNQFIGNTYAGLATDLRDTSTGQMDVVNNLMSSTAVQNTAPTLTFVLDFVQAGQNITDPFGGGVFTPFDVTSFGFAATDYDLVTNAVLDTVRQHYYNIPTTGSDSRSPMPNGKQLDVNFVIGDLGSAPSIGATEYYTAVIGSAPSAPALGVAFLSSVRDAAGNGPRAGFSNGSHVASVYTNEIVGLGGLTPADVVIPDEKAGVHYDVAGGDGSMILQDALTSGNLNFTRNAIAGTTSHEIGHTLSLTHMNVAGSVTPTGAPPIMGTGAIDTPNQARIGLREFGYSGFDGENGNAPIAHVQQLIGALGTRDAAVAGVSGNGIKINATDSAHLKPSTFINNTITNNSIDGIAITMNNSAVAEGVTIQGNTITGNSGRGIDLQANGAAAFIDADSTIGGTGTNTLGGSSFSQGNTINNNQSDGLRALASNGGTIHGNAINNRFEQNGGNGIALAIDKGGSVDFGTVASNRRIQGNNIVGNGGSGISLVSNVTPTSQADMKATILGNTINNNVGGGIVSNQNGPNSVPPAPPAVIDNNRLALNIGGTATTDSNTITGNGDVGIGVEVTGNAKAIVNITNATVTGTVDGADTRWNGDGLGLRRADQSLLIANVTNSRFNQNAGDGLDLDAQGADRFDPTQPMSGTANTVTVTDSAFNNNGQNGARYRIRGKATVIGDTTGSTFNNNGQNGMLVNTSEFSSFGDPTVGLPPGRRSMLDGNTFNENGVDGVQMVATEDSRVLAAITSTSVPASSSAHAGANTNGSTSISRNGRDGVRITTTGGRSDILITAGTATTTIDGNGIGGAGGNGIRWDASGASNGVVRVTRTTITNSVAGRTESTALNGNGVLDPGEDVNGNGVLDPGEDANANQDVDVAEGDGIQANFQDTTTSTLIVGNVGEGNIIQNNGDDGIAITTTGQDQLTSIGVTPVQTFFGNPRPVITITDNTIGGTNNGVNAGNRGDGVSLNVLGGTAVGIAPANVDNVISATDFFTDQFNGILGATQSGSVPQFTMSNNLVSNNARRGVNVELTGASGTRDREFGASNFDPVRITLTGNTVSSNGEEGIMYRADSEMNQSRFVFLGNPVVDNQNYLPGQAQFFALNAGSVNGNTAYASPYLNLRTVQNSYLIMTNNTVQNNGTRTVTGEGLRIDVGTGAYVAADIRGNTFGGNLEEDVVTSSFLSAGNTFNSVDSTTVDTTFDFVYLDDTAQLDMRFQNNSGNQIAPSDVGATYFNADPLKAQFFGNLGVLQREAALFQVDNGPNLNNPNNVFVNFGTTQGISNAFTNGGYNLRLGPDAGWDVQVPNLGFAPFLP